MAVAAELKKTKLQELSRILVVFGNKDFHCRNN